MTNSPLGQYAPLVATVTSLFVIGGYVVALMLQTPLGITPDAIDKLGVVALIAVGAVFGSAVSVNGWKQPLSATHVRQDTVERTVAQLAGVIAEVHPAAAPAVTSIINEPRVTTSGSQG